MPRISPKPKTVAVIFDFDGVIADSRDIFLETLRGLLGRTEPFTNEEMKDLHNSSTRQVIKKLGIRPWQVPVFVVKGRQRIARQMDQVTIYQGMPRALKVLQAAGTAIYILSSGNKEAIQGFLNRYDLDTTVTAIYGGTSLFGKAKGLQNLMKHEQLAPDECIYVGDETRDIDGAKQVHVRSVAVGWGYNALDTLKLCEPSVAVARPQNLVEAINSLQQRNR